MWMKQKGGCDGGAQKDTDAGGNWRAGAVQGGRARRHQIQIDRLPNNNV